MKLRDCIVGLVMLAMLALAPRAALAQNDPYAVMLSYLDASRIDGYALNGSSGAIALNLAAGDANQQANLRAFALGTYATTRVHASQTQRGNTSNPPTIALASIGGQALGNASGLISINQASGTANLELNSVGAVSTRQGIRETSADQWLASVCACAQEAMSTGSGQSDSGTRQHAALVEASAMQGVHGIVQVNQIAGSGNVTANQLSLDVGLPPR